MMMMMMMTYLILWAGLYDHIADNANYMWFYHFRLWLRCDLFYMMFLICNFLVYIGLMTAVLVNIASVRCQRQDVRPTDVTEFRGQNVMFNCSGTTAKDFHITRSVEYTTRKQVWNTWQLQLACQESWPRHRWWNISVWHKWRPNPATDC